MATSRTFDLRVGKHTTVRAQAATDQTGLSDTMGYLLTGGARNLVAAYTDLVGLADGDTETKSGVANLNRTPNNAADTPDGFALEAHPTKFVRFGTNVWAGRGQGVAAQHDWYDTNVSRPVTYRHFDGGGLTTWNNSDMTYLRNNRPWCRRIYWSFKGADSSPTIGPSDWTQAEINAWMASIPTQTAANGGYDFFLTWYHEPEDNWTGATNRTQFRNRQRALSDYVRSFNRNNVEFGMITVASSLHQSAGTYWLNAPALYPGDGYLDFVGQDAYWNHDDRGNQAPAGQVANYPYGNYPLPDDTNEPVKWNWALESLPVDTDVRNWAITETGFTWDMVNDPTGAVRLRMVKKAVQWWSLHAFANGMTLRDVLWWDSKGTQQGSTFDSRIEGRTTADDVSPTAEQALRQYAQMCEYSRHRMGNI